MHSVPVVLFVGLIAWMSKVVNLLGARRRWMGMWLGVAVWACWGEFIECQWSNSVHGSYTNTRALFCWLRLAPWQIFGSTRLVDVVVAVVRTALWGVVAGRGEVSERVRSRRVTIAGRCGW